jgi:hypothetical protein
LPTSEPSRGGSQELESNAIIMSRTLRLAGNSDEAFIAMSSRKLDGLAILMLTVASCSTVSNSN